jgi:hypothetical protein
VQAGKALIIGMAACIFSGANEGVFWLKLNRNVLIAWILLVSILSGCNAQPAIEATLPAASQTVEGPPPDPTQASTQTPAPTSTASVVPNPTATPLLQPTSEMNTARLLATGFLPRWEFFFTVETSQPVQMTYYAIVARDKRYECEIVTQNPNRLYCWGPLVGVDKWVEYGMYEVGTDKKVHGGRFFIPIELDP